MNVGDVIWEEETAMSRFHRGVHNPVTWTPCDQPVSHDSRVASMSFADGWLYCNYRGQLYRYRTVDVNYLMQKMSEGVEL